MCQVVRLYSVVETVVMSGEVACCSVVCGTLVNVFLFECEIVYVLGCVFCWLIRVLSSKYICRCVVMVMSSA